MSAGSIVEANDEIIDIARVIGGAVRYALLFGNLGFPEHESVSLQIVKAGKTTL